MERKRVDLSGQSEPTRRSKARSAAGENALSTPKNIALLSIAGVSILIAAYLVYANFIATGGAPEAANAPQVEAAFTEAGQQAPPPEPPQVNFEPGSGKHLGK